MSPLIAAVLFQTGDADSLWQSVAKAHKGFSAMAYKVQVVNIDPKGKTQKLEYGTLDYKRHGNVTFRYRDDVERVNATMSRGKDGKWSNGASDDANSTTTANNALGYCDSIPSRWSYAPALLMERGEIGHSVDWNKEAPAPVTFRSVACYLLRGVQDKTPVKVWIERRRLVLLRIEEDFGKTKKVTAFESVKASRSSS